MYGLGTPVLNDDIIAALLDSFFLIDKEFNIVRFNNASLTLTGYNFFDLGNMKITDIIIIESNDEDSIRNIFVDKDILSLNHKLKTKKGEVIPVLVHASITNDKDT